MVSDPGPRAVKVSDIARWIKCHCDNPDGSRTRGVTFLLGAGFSVSAGIPTAAEMVAQVLRAHPMLQKAGQPPPGQTEYMHLMTMLPASERTRIIRDAIRKAEDPDLHRVKINWAHLLVATLVEAGYVHQILTRSGFKTV